MKKILKVLLFIVILFSLSLGAYYVYDYFLGSETDEQPVVKVIKKIDKYDYSLKENASSLYKDEFDNLSKILGANEIDYEKYAESIAKLFIIDFYTLNNKLSKNDVGGIEFVHPDIRDNFIEHARSTIYRYIKFDKKNKSDFPEVSKISDIQLIETEFTFKNDKSVVLAYKINIMWEYKEDMDYEKAANTILVKKDDKLYIVEMD